MKEIEGMIKCKSNVNPRISSNYNQARICKCIGSDKFPSKGVHSVWGLPWCDLLLEEENVETALVVMEMRGGRKHQVCQLVLLHLSSHRHLNNKKCHTAYSLQKKFNIFIPFLIYILSKNNFEIQFKATSEKHRDDTLHGWFHSLISVFNLRRALFGKAMCNIWEQHKGNGFNSMMRDSLKGDDF